MEDPEATLLYSTSDNGRGHPRRDPYVTLLSGRHLSAQSKPQDYVRLRLVIIKYSAITRLNNSNSNFTSTVQFQYLIAFPFFFW